MNNIGIRKSSSLSYIPGLDGIRAIAVLAVILCHYSSPFTPALTNAGSGWFIYSAIANLGWVGVDIFFVISGYLIAKMLLKRPIGTISQYGDFILKRVWRLLPAYVACLLVFTTIAVLFVPESKVLLNSLHLWTVTSNIQSSFIHRAALMDGYFNLAHFWSLAVEWHFYLTLPIFIFLFRSIKATAIFFIILAIFSRFTLQHFGASDNAIYSFTLCRIDALAFGCLLAISAHRISEKQSNFISMIGLAIFISVMLLIAQSPIPYKKLPWMQLYGYSLIAISVAMMLAAIINAKKQTWVVKLLEKPVMLVIGRASYSLYIWHLVFFPGVANFAISTLSNPLYAFMLTFILSGFLSAVLACISFKLIESKFYLDSRKTLNTLNSIPNSSVEKHV